MPTTVPTAEMATAAAKYADLIVAFVVAQTLGFCFAAMKEIKFRAEVVRLRPVLLPALIFVNLIYLLGIVVLAVLEFSLRHNDTAVCVATAVFVVGRLVAFALFCGLTLIVVQTCEVKPADIDLTKLKSFFKRQAKRAPGDNPESTVSSET